MIRVRLCISAFALAATPIHAQSLPPPIAGSQVTKLSYESVFIDYRPYAEVEVALWERTNRNDAIPGGHMGHRVSDTMPDAPMNAAPASAPLSAAPTAGHANHANHPQ